MVLLWIGILLVSLFVLVKAADLFVENSEKIGLALKIPPFIIGATLIAIGTSLPELITSIIAAINNSTEFIAGNVIGSNISNIGLIIGVCAVFGSKLIIKRKKTKKDSIIAILTILLSGFVIWDRTISFLDAFILLIPFVYVLFSLIKEKDTETQVKHTILKPQYFLFVLLSSIGIYYSSIYVVTSVQELTILFGLTDTSIIAMTAVALGTSLPELSVSLTAVRQKKIDIAIGNILGSNIFNILFILSIPALITPLVISTTVFFFAFPAMIVFTLLLFVFLHTQKTLHAWEGLILIALYSIYMILSFTFSL